MPQITKIKRQPNYCIIYTATILNKSEEQAIKTALVNQFGRIQTGHIFFRVEAGE